MRLRRKGAPTRADWAARRRRLARKRAAAAKPRDARPLAYERDRSDARKRPATAILAFVLNFFFPGAGLIVYGKKQWAVAFIAVTAVSFYIFWPLTWAFTTGLTLNFALRKEV